MGLWLCKQLDSETPSKKHYLSLVELQSQVLKYIFSPSKIQFNPQVEFAQDYIPFGYPSLSSLVRDIPINLIEKFEKSFDQNPFIQRFHVGERCYVRDSDVFGICTDIEVTQNTETNKFTILVTLSHESRGNKYLQERYSIGSLITEKFYFYKLLTKPEQGSCSDDMSKRTHQEAFKAEEETLLGREEKESSPGQSSSQTTNFLVENEALESSKKEVCTDAATETASYSIPRLYSVNEQFPTKTENRAKKMKPESNEEPEQVTHERIPRKKSKKTPRSSSSSETKPQKIKSLNIQSRCGMNKGLQGRNNSCYLDSLLFSLLFSTKRFDYSLLVPKPEDSSIATSLREILREDIAHKLRSKSSKHFCSFEDVRKLRECLGQIDPRILGAMMDVEEAFYLIVREILKEKEFFQYEEGTREFMHQIFICEDEGSPKTSSIQWLVEKSFQLWGNMRLACVPYPAFILQVPRSDGELVHFTSIVPSLELDISTLMDQKKCQSCKIEVAEWEEMQSDAESIEGNFRFGSLQCGNCSVISQDSVSPMTRQFVSLKWMDLYSVICIRSAHYVCFTRHHEALGGKSHENSAKDNCWLFFDSMAGSSSEVINLKNFDATKLTESNLNSSANEEFSSYTRRMLEDNHLCIYIPRIK